MALTTLQTLGLVGLGVGTAALGYAAVRSAQARARLREQRELPAGPTCPEGLTPHMIEGEWQCLPVAAFEECLEGIYASDRVELPDSIAGLLNEDAQQTAEQFYGFNLTPEAMEEAYTAMAAQIPGHTEPEEIYFQVLQDLMPCEWPLSEAAAGPALAAWPLDFNYYLDPPDGVTDRMEQAARSLFDLWVVALSQHLEQFLPVDVDPVAVVSDPERDTCAQDDVLMPRERSVPTSEGVILGALEALGFDPQTQNVDEIMAQLEAENPMLIEYLEMDWRIPKETQDAMWEIFQQVADFPKPVTNTVFNAQMGASCPWEEKDAYTINMASFWYAGKRIAAIAELAGLAVPVLVRETAQADEGA